MRPRSLHSFHNGIGRMILKPMIVDGTRTLTLDMQDVAPGAYYLLATGNGQQSVIKLMLQR